MTEVKTPEVESYENPDDEIGPKEAEKLNFGGNKNGRKNK